MKRIIDGVTYNTDTSTVVARAETVEPEWGGNPEERKKFTLYQTRGGAFFVHTHIEWTVLNRRTEEPEERERDVFVPMTRDEAHKWIMEGEVELMNDVFGEPPEAAEEAAPGATIYLRVPASLKDRIETAASDDRLSVNAWTMRCVERCAGINKVGELLGEIMQTAQSELAGADSAGMIQHMRQQAESIAEFFGWREKELEDLCSSASVAAAQRLGDHYRWPLPEEESEAERRARIDALLDAQKAEDARREQWRGRLERRG